MHNRDETRGNFFLRVLVFWLALKLWILPFSNIDRRVSKALLTSRKTSAVPPLSGCTARHLRL